MTTEPEGGELYEGETLLASGSSQVTERVTGKLLVWTTASSARYP